MKKLKSMVNLNFLILCFTLLAVSLQGVEVTNLQLSEVCFHRLDDNTQGLTKGYTLSFSAELPEKSVIMMNGKVEKAIADNNDNLLPTSQYDQAIYPHLSDNKKSVRFDVNLPLPGKQVKGIKEISGWLEYFTASGKKKVDLKIKAFEKGATGKLNSIIKAVGETKWNKNFDYLSLKIKAKNEEIKNITFYDQENKEIRFSGWSSSWDKESVTRTFTYSGHFPKTGRIVVLLYQNLKKKKTTFRIKNISLLGDPKE